VSRFRPIVVRDSALDWVKFDAELARDGSVDPTDKALYAAIASFVPQGDRESDADPDGEDIPTRKVLAACIGRSVDTVDRCTKRLEDRGLLEVERRPDPENPKRNIPSVYRLLDHHRWDERAAERAEKRKAEAEARRAEREAAKARKAEEIGEGGGRTHAARVAAPMRPGWPHPCGQGGRTSAAVPSFSQEFSLSEGAEGDANAASGALGTGEEKSINDQNGNPASAPGASVPAQQGPHDEDALAVLAAYQEAYGAKAMPGTRAKILAAAAELLAAGRPLAWVLDRARELPKYGNDLVRHAEICGVPIPRPAAAPPAPAADRCQKHPHFPTDCPTCRRAALRTGPGLPQQIDASDLIGAS
jgi:DNA-binding MarR family transcriptional regulator